MRNRFLILFVAVATLFACNSDSMSTDEMNKPGGERATPINIKIKKVEGTYNFIPDAECGEVTLTAIGEGIVSHLGPSSLVEQWCFNGQIPDLGKREITITAANGDELYGFHDSVIFDPATLSFIETFNFKGGTGRFANASGTFTEYVQIFPEGPGPSPGTFTLSGEGSLIYNTKE